MVSDERKQMNEEGEKNGRHSVGWNEIYFDYYIKKMSTDSKEDRRMSMPSYHSCAFESNALLTKHVPQSSGIHQGMMRQSISEYLSNDTENKGIVHIDVSDDEIVEGVSTSKYKSNMAKKKAKMHIDISDDETVEGPSTSNYFNNKIGKTPIVHIDISDDEIVEGSSTSGYLNNKTEKNRNVHIDISDDEIMEGLSMSNFASDRKRKGKGKALQLFDDGNLGRSADFMKGKRNGKSKAEKLETLKKSIFENNKKLKKHSLSQFSFFKIADSTENLAVLDHRYYGVASNSDLKHGEPLVSELQNLKTGNSQCKKHFIDGESFEKYKQFKHFDIVIDFSDHHYSLSLSEASKNKALSKKIQSEWKILQKDLPEGIYVRVYEDRMDLLRAVIIGPSGTPYHDGLFFFDVFFPNNYPNSPPNVYYHSRGLRLNPNLYENGYVCLSLLGTWSGHGCENWNPKCSTMLQVLVSIQALVLNFNPFFNEPGYSSFAGNPTYKIHSIHYNEKAFLLSCKTMLFLLKNPPKHFADFVVGHFCETRRKILAACEAYNKGAQIGCVDGNTINNAVVNNKTGKFRIPNDLMAKLMEALPIKG